ncbi:MAG: serine/threonine protein kinase, partial [Planctomycetes bacterium]|nr:serine/threonine protein kinase [Planctomycetota bacterium]
MSIPLPCPESDLLRAILRGSVEPDDEERIALHLESCEQCRRTIDLISGVDGEGESTVSESHFDTGQRDVSPVVVPAAISAEPLAPELQAVMEHLKEDEIPSRGASATEASEEFTRSLPSGMDAFIKQLLDKAEPGQPATIGHYELGPKIGRGGMGAVYQAYDRKLSRDVAIKFLKPDLTRDGTFVERFVREAQAAAGVIHPNVVTVHSIEETNGVPWIVMELIEGESLRKRLRRFGPLTLTSVARIGAQIAEGLQAAHEKRLIHRDIKPSNIVLLEDLDEVRITDFGLAQLEGATRLTKSGMLMGTPKYMAPEQARGEKVDHRSDLFSLGSVLYAMCTGRAPFEGKNDAEVVSNVAKHQLNPIETVDPTLPRWLTGVISKLLEPNPEDRFQSAQEVAVNLRRSLEDAEFDLTTDGGWEENTAIDGSPGFLREAAETLVEGAPYSGDPTRTAALATATKNSPDTTVSRPAKPVAARKTQNAVIAAGLILLCLLIPVLAGWVEFGSEDPDPGLAGVDDAGGKPTDRDSSYEQDVL